jgi:hypothetical protein
VQHEKFRSEHPEMLIGLISAEGKINFSGYTKQLGFDEVEAFKTTAIKNLELAENYEKQSARDEAEHFYYWAQSSARLSDSFNELANDSLVELRTALLRTPKKVGFERFKESWILVSLGENRPLFTFYLEGGKQSQKEMEDSVLMQTELRLLQLGQEKAELEKMAPRLKSLSRKLYPD